MDNIRKINNLYKFNPSEYNDNDIIIDDQDIDDVAKLSPKYIIEYVVEKYKQLYKKFNDIIDNTVQNGLGIGYNRILSPYIELYIFEDKFYDLNFEDTQIFGKYGNKSCATPAWLTKLQYIRNNEQQIKNGEINIMPSFSLDIDPLKGPNNKNNWVYKLLLDFLDYIKENTDYLYGTHITRDNIYNESYFTISTFDYNEHIFYMLKNALDIFEKYIDFIDMNLLNYMDNSLNEELQKFDITDYNEDDSQIIDNQTIKNTIKYTPDFITKYAISSYEELHMKYNKVMDKCVKNGFRSIYVEMLNPYIELLVLEEPYDDAISFEKRQLSYLDVNKTDIEQYWKSMLNYIIKNKSKNAEVYFGLYIETIKDHKNISYIYKFLVDFFTYLKNNVNYYIHAEFDPDYIDNTDYYDISTYDTEDIFYSIDNALDIYEKYINFIDMNLLNYMNNSLNEELEEFHVEDYNDESIIDHQTVEDVLVTPKTTDELYKLIAERLKKNPENPYLLDIDTSNIKDMRALFCPILNGGKLEGNQYIFSNEYKLDPGNIKTIDIHTWNTSNVEDMSFMFNECSNLKSVNLSGINTSNVRSMANMFGNCQMIINIDLSNLNMSNVTNFSCMFTRCLLLENIDMSGCNPKKAEQVVDMFNNCRNIKYIRLPKQLAGKLLTYHLQDEVTVHMNTSFIPELPYKIDVS